MDLKPPLHILCLEDDVEDFEFIQATLRQSQILCETVLVQTGEAYASRLEQDNFDLIISDLTLPGYDGMLALELRQKKRPNVPFIFVSGTLGEDTAVAALKAGATDYVLKDNLSKLPHAVWRAIRENNQKKEKEEAAASLRFAEAQLRHVQKMDAIGRLASGVAHDINNILTIIQGYGHSVLMSLDGKDERREEMKEILEASMRAAGLTKQLLAFSRKQIFLDSQPQNPNQIVQNMEKMIRRIIGEDINVSINLEPDLKWIKIDMGQLEQVILNLVVNARDAMLHGGEFKIESKNVELDPFAAGEKGVPPGAYVMLRFSDSGCGMDQEVRSRLFEPFFTTKEMGKGTGLGLSTVYGIVTHHGGAIDVQSEPDKGAVFLIYFPVTTETATANPTPPETAPAVAGHETVLLVEDEEAVRKVLVHILSQSGYTVLQAKDGRQALDMYEKNQEKIDLVISDVIMPEMGGFLLEEKIRAKNAAAKVLFLSGYMNGTKTKQAAPETGTWLVQKPVAPQTLLAEVRRRLAE